MGLRIKEQKNSNYFALDEYIFDNKESVDEDRKKLIKLITLEKNFYTVFRNTIRTEINAYKNIEKRKIIEDIIDSSKVAEAYSKVMTADFIVSVSRKVEDKIANTGRFHVIKNRFGPDGITFPSTINTNIGKIIVYESSTQGGREVQGKMDNSEEFLRKTLSNKYNDMSKNTDGFE